MKLSQRNLTDDQRAMIADAVIRIESKLAMKARAKVGRAAGGKATEEQKAYRLLAEASNKRSKPGAKSDTRAAVSKRAKVSERRIKLYD